jgi:hypothetical protein
MSFEKIDMLLPCSVNKIEEKISMKPKEAIEWSEKEKEMVDYRKQKKLKQTGMK